MGTYCSVRDVRLALTPSASDTDKSTGASLPDWQIEDAIDEAEGHVKAYLSARYVITTSSVTTVDPVNPLITYVWIVAPQPVRGWTRNIAAYLCALTFRQSKDLGEDDPIRLRYNMTMVALMGVRDRATDLDLPPATTPDDQGVSVHNLYEGRLFDLKDTGLAYGDDRVQYLEPRFRDV